jgi:hypothetical protein
MVQFRNAVPALVAVGALAVGSVPAGASDHRGSVRLYSPARDVVMTVHHVTSPDGDYDWVDFSPAMYFEARGSRFEIDVRRPSYDKALRATVTVGGRERKLPAKLLRGWVGLKKAFTITWRTPAGAQLTQSRMDWCPNDGQGSRLSPRAATTTAFIQNCGWNPFTRSQRWGIDRDWARQVFPYDVAVPADLGDHAVLEVALRRRLGRILDIPAKQRRLRFDVTVKQVDETEDWSGDGSATTPPAPSGSVTSTSSSSQRSAPSAPRSTGFRPPRSALPDLVPLPAFGISTGIEDGRDLLAFGATVYNRGPGPMVAEGFRHGSTLRMDAHQMFYRGTRLVGSTRVGTMAYDTRESHQHWHFKDFATYDLVNGEHHRLRTSGKEAFCLAPTDPIDLLVRGAVVDPGDGDLETACGDLSSIWVREVLATGWGDTYTQDRAGQAIDITGLPNGTYWIRVTANPGGRLYERSRKNDVSYRRVVLGGTPGARTVRVPKYGRVDSEKGFTGDGGGFRTREH